MFGTLSSPGSRTAIRFLILILITIGFVACQDAKPESQERVLIEGKPVNNSNKAVDHSFSNYELITLDANRIYETFIADPDKPLQLKLGSYGDYEVTLEANELMAEGHTFKSDATDENLFATSGTYKSTPESKYKARFSFSPKSLAGKVYTDTAAVLIRPVGFYDKSAPENAFVIASSSDVKPLDEEEFRHTHEHGQGHDHDNDDQHDHEAIEAMLASAPDTLVMPKEDLTERMAEEGKGFRNNDPNCDLKLRVGIDHEYWTRFAQPYMGVIAYFTYLNEYEDLLAQIGVNEVEVVSGYAAFFQTAPWGTSTQYSTMRNAFRNWADANIPNSGHELSMVITGSDVFRGSENILGATVGYSICQPSGIMVVESAVFPEFTTYTMAHETGHTMGVIEHLNTSPLVDICPAVGTAFGYGVIMSTNASANPLKTYTMHSRFRIQHFLNTINVCDKGDCLDILRIRTIRQPCFKPNPIHNYLYGYGLYEIVAPDYIGNQTQLLPQYTWSSSNGTIIANGASVYLIPTQPGQVDITVSVTDGCPGLYTPAVISKTFTVNIPACGN